MTEKTGLLHKIALTKIEKVGTVLAKQLVSYCGGVEAVFRESKRSLTKIPKIGNSLADQILSSDVFKQAEQELNFVLKHGIDTYFYLDNNYPKRLKSFEDAPTLLYARGKLKPDHPRTVGIVGTRNPTEYGLFHCEKLINELKSLNVAIISGLAFGIDTIAHQSAVSRDIHNIGVLAHGLDRIYPHENKRLSKRMENNGGLLSEYGQGSIPSREHFPLRNRIIAMMSDAVVVVESASSGGSMITAEFANAYNKDVFAVPGRLGDTKSAGCNQLIKTHKAALISSAKDIAYIMRWDKDAKAIQKPLFIELSSDEKMLLDQFDRQEGAHLDKLHYSLRWPIAKISTLLLNLEFKGAIKSLPGKKYILAP